MLKETYIKFRCTEQFKELVENNAKKHGRSVSSYIEYLIRKDADTMKIINITNVTEELEEVLKMESTCFLSSDEYSWLFTDNKVFNEISQKFEFDIETEEREKIYSSNIEDYLFYKYDGGDGSYDYFGCYIELAEYREKVAQLAEKNGLGENWDIQLDKWSKEFAMKEIISKIKTGLEKMKSEGWDVVKLKEEIMK